ncbi:hypothetical protein LXL04_032931 [Taraxacum kok-saghyz]
MKDQRIRRFEVTYGRDMQVKRRNRGLREIEGEGMSIKSDLNRTKPDLVPGPEISKGRTGGWINGKPRLPFFQRGIPSSRNPEGQFEPIGVPGRTSPHRGPNAQDLLEHVRLTRHLRTPYGLSNPYASRMP